MTNFVTELQTSVMANRMAVALERDDSMTFSQLWSATNSFAGGLTNREISAGDCVVIHTSNPRAVLIAVYGTLRAGCVPVTLPQSYESWDVRHVLNETEAKALVTDSSPIMGLLASSEPLRVAVTVDSDARMGIDFPDFLDNGGMNGANSRTGIDVVRCADDTPGLIAYLERDTDEPLAVVYTHAALSASAAAGATICRDEESTTLEAHLGACPLSNPIELLFGANATLVSGGRYRPVASPDPDTIRSLLVATDVDRAFVTPAQYDALRASETSMARRGLAIVDAMPTTTVDQVAETDDAVRLVGRPETGITHVRTREDIDAGWLGRPLSDARARVVSGPTGGELAVSGPGSMAAYYERPSLTDDVTVTIDGTCWLRTGVPATAQDGTVFLAEDADAARETAAT
ncbi:AMP-binding protein [Haloarchaeobius amylolyticus]|uniref:AMP-binding protein n=1 Tax=Haloarchaeobius amylolyticus TaxID=1198296 RepID=A0ABD6BIL9_9EURY